MHISVSFVTRGAEVRSVDQKVVVTFMPALYFCVGLSGLNRSYLQMLDMCLLLIDRFMIDNWSFMSVITRGNKHL